MKLTALTTPIGNIEDSSRRLIDHLSTGTLFFVEDTRRFFQLLSLLNIDKEGKKVVVFNDHKQDTVSNCLELLKNSEQGYLVSDAGSPLLSDPGFPLFKAVVDADGVVESIPGPSAAVVALEVSCLPPTPYMFHGFFPRGKGEGEKVLKRLIGHVTHAFFESPNRIQTTLELIQKYQSDSDIVVVRELTKKYEEHFRFKGHEAVDYKEKITCKGEFVLLLRTQESEIQDDSLLKELASSYLDKPSSKKLAKLMARVLGEKVGDIYDQLNGLK